jgi:hypothetical protein
MHSNLFSLALALGLTALALSFMYGGSKLYTRHGIVSYVGLPIILAGIIFQSMAGMVVLGLLKGLETSI